ncbi:MAG: PQQ-binding-like beta-propeller repeat protein [Lentisphaerae bacterium]|nr:PQQ-binding-like beta-propeller repeat protein [Lentisphaerota bacterium]
MRRPFTIHASPFARLLTALSLFIICFVSSTAADTNRVLNAPVGDVRGAIEALRSSATKPGPLQADATRRLAALARVGAVAPSDTDLLRAHESLFTAQIRRGDVFDGSITLDALGELDGKGMSWRLLHAQLFAASARLDLTAREHDALLVQVAGRHSVRSIATQIDRVSALVRRRTLDDESVWRMEAERDRQLLWLRTVEAGMTDRDAAPVSSMIIDSARDSILYETPSDRDLQRSYWVALDRIIGSQQSPGVKQLRISQDSAVEQDLRLARESGDVTALLALWRRYPWAHEANVALLDYASRMLREGRPSLAAASFRDVSTHTQDPKLLDQARTGLALCGWDRSTTTDDDYGERSAIFSSSSVIVARDRPPNSGDSDLRRIHLPAVSTHHPAVLFARHIADDWTSALWPLVDVQFIDDFVLAASPSMLACYRADDTSEPAWQRVLRGSWRTSGRDEDVILPHSARPAVDGSRIYARWGRTDVVGDLRYDLMVEGRSMPASRMRRLHTGFAAFDLRTGRALWATADMPEWKNLLPAGDPVVDAHSVYLPVVVGDRFSLERETVEFVMICADKTDGRMRWQQTVGWIKPVVRGGTHNRHVWLPGLAARTTEVDGMLYTVTGNGLVACLDARDGMLAWKREYAGYEPTPSSIAVHAQRRNHEPIPRGNLMVMAVRDRPGVWAVKKDTGHTAWDLPWLPSQAVLPLPGNRLFLQDTRDAVVVSAKDGRLAWRRRFAEPIRGHAWSDTPDTLRVPVGKRLLRIANGSGETLAESPAAEHGLVSCYAQRDETVFYASSTRTAAREDSRPPPGSKEAALGKTGGRESSRAVRGSYHVLPVSDDDGSAHVRRRVPRLFEPPDTSPLTGTVFLSSDGFLEALDAAGAETRWRRALRPDFIEPLFAGPAVLIGSRRRIVTVDGRTGTFLWQAAVPETVESWHVVGNRVVGVGTDHLFALEMGTGERAWSVPLPSRKRIALAKAVAEGLCLVVESWDKEAPPKPIITIHVYSADDGVSLREYSLPVEECKAASAAGDHAWIVGSDRHVHHVDLTSGKVTRSGEPVLTKAETTIRGSRKRWSAVIFATDGPYALLDGVLPKLRKRWVFKADGTSFAPGGTRNYLLGDRKLCEARGRRIRIVDLDSGKEVAVCTIPISHEVEVARRRGDRLLVLSLMTPPGKAASPVHGRHYSVDLFDAVGGRIVGRSLPGMRPVSWTLRDGKGTWGNELAWVGDRVMVTDPYGLHSLVLRQEAYAQREEPQVLVYRTARSITADGSLEEFDEPDRIPAAAARGDAAPQCFVTQDGKDLILAVSYLNARPDALLERSRLISAGDRLEMELRTNRKPDERSVLETFRWNVGLSGDGHAVFTPDAPAGIRGVVGYDMDTRLMTFEMAVPLASITDRTHLRHADLRFSMAVRDDEYGPAPVAVWREVPLRLHKMTRSEEAHGLAIAAAFPALNESQWFLKQVIEAHVTDWPTGRTFAQALLKKHARSPFAAWILRYMDKRIESRTGMRDFEGLRAVAARAGVSPTRSPGTAPFRRPKSGTRPASCRERTTRSCRNRSRWTGTRSRRSSARGSRPWGSVKPPPVSSPPTSGCSADPPRPNWNS